MSYRAIFMAIFPIISYLLHAVASFRERGRDGDLEREREGGEAPIRFSTDSPISSLIFIINWRYEDPPSL